MRPEFDPRGHGAPVNTRRDSRIILLAALAALALTVIGVRFMLWPDAASRFFGLIGRPNGFQLHTVVGLRDLWLGVLALAFCWLRDWRALAIWLGLGALVCFGDAGIVFGARGKPPAILFHLLSGVFCFVLALLSWRRWLRDKSAPKSGP